MEMYKTKDLLLKAISKSERATIVTNDFIDKSDFGYHIVITLCDEFSNSRYVDITRLTSNNKERKYNYMVTMTPHGFFFLNQEGGYTSFHKKQIANTRNARIIPYITIISTAAIIYVTYLNYKATDKANDNSANELKFKSEINELQFSKDSLQKIVNNDTCFNKH